MSERALETGLKSDTYVAISEILNTCYPAINPLPLLLAALICPTPLVAASDFSLITSGKGSHTHWMTSYFLSDTDFT